MAGNLEIGQLPEAVDIEGDELVEIVQNGNSRHTSAQHIVDAPKGTGQLLVHTRGTVTGGTEQPEPSDGALQTATNGGAHELAAPTENGYYRLRYTNSAVAGEITPTGWDVVFDRNNALEVLAEGAEIEFIAVNDGHSVLQITLLEDGT